MSKLGVYSDDTRSWHLLEADALATLAKLPDACVDSIVTDPPYAIGFGEAAWDSFGSKRTAPAAFERWTSKWAGEALRVLKPGGHLLAFGAPRTFHRLSNGIEDAGFDIRDVVLWLGVQGMPKSRRLPGGLGTALKPAYEPILLARKPLAGTTSDNVNRFGTGALGIEHARVGDQRYWPAHVVATHAPSCTYTHCTTACAVRMLDASRPNLQPSRLFFCAKATRAEREAGCEQLPMRSVQLYTGKRRAARARRNLHPTVKPIALMRWLVALVTPPGGVVLDPFTGSGSTGAAAVLEGRRFLGVEREAAYVDIACARITHWAHTTGAASR